MIYLANPYAHTDPSLMVFRFFAACRKAAELIRAGEIVFSPIAPSHPIATLGEMAACDHSLWLRQDLEILRRCDRLLVYRLPGWEESVGIKAEIEAWEAMGREVEYVD